MNDIVNLINEYNAYITLYAALITLAMIITTITNTKRKRRYMLWKKDVFNLGVFVREWERNEDKFIEELFSENEKLSDENKALKSHVTKFAIVLFIIYIAFNIDKIIKNIKETISIEKKTI